jgi:hypothetical protein
MAEITGKGNDLGLQPVYDQLTELIRNARRKVEVAVNSELILLHWNIGKTIKSSVLSNQRAEYGKQTIDTLSRQLSQEYGRGFSRRNLFNMVRFYEAFPDSAIVQSLIAQLTWTHLLELVNINDPLKRDFYLTMCINERWSVRTLKNRIATLLYERTVISQRSEATIKNDLGLLRQEKQMTPELFFAIPMYWTF